MSTDLPEFPQKLLSLCSAPGRLTYIYLGAGYPCLSVLCLLVTPGLWLCVRGKKLNLREKRYSGNHSAMVGSIRYLLMVVDVKAGMYHHFLPNKSL